MILKVNLKMNGMQMTGSAYQENKLRGLMKMQIMLFAIYLKNECLFSCKKAVDVILITKM